MRLNDFALRLGVFALAAVICAVAARAVVATVESRSVEAVELSLEDGGYGFATVIGDGLQVILEGEAESEAQRFRTISNAGGIVDASRVIDNMTVAASDAIVAPEFSLEVLRNDSGVSVIGLIPAKTDREYLSDTLSDMAGQDGNFADFLETADYDVPEDWDVSVNFALRALRQLPRSKISVRSGRVDVQAIADSPEEKARLESSLSQSTPPQVILALNVSAPRPVISPFVTRFMIDEDGARFDSCVADTPAAERRIVVAAEAAGAAGRLGCTIALGAPTGQWADGVTQSIAALAELGGGTATISDADVTLVAEPGTVQGLFDRVVGELENDLPDMFALEAVLPALPDANSEGPPQFTATLSPEGLVQLRGRVSDDLLNMTVENFARAKFSDTEIAMGTRVVDGLPMGWPVRILAGVEALSHLSNGSVVVEPDKITVRGNTGEQDAGGEITRLLIEKLGEAQEFDVDVTYVEELDPIAALPTEEECIAQITAVTDVRKITFEPGSANIAGEGASIIDDIAEILQKCPTTRIEIAGYTDSQGSEAGNQRLSQQRANAVLDALRVRRVPVASFRAIGYGEENPIADNSTEAGREANRRIEFTLIVPESSEEMTALEQIEEENAAQSEDGDAATEDGAENE